MRVYHDEDADLALLAERRIAVMGYGNQGRSQALNMRDSGLEVIVGNRDDEYGRRACEDGFEVIPIGQAAARADIVLMLVPDEVAPTVFQAEIAPSLARGTALVFASGYNVAFGYVSPPTDTDVVLVAPRMIGSGVRDLYVAGHGFPAFVGVAQDFSGQARALALALAKAIGATRTGVVETTFAQETELDLFTEQCFGPAFGQVLMTAVDLLLEKGYPPEAVLLELYMSGEFSYTLRKIAELGTVEQTKLHSRTSQYGSMSRGLRFRLPELRAKMAQGLAEIQSGTFAREWAAEQADGSPTLAMLQESARALPLHELEQELRQALRDVPHPELVQFPREQVPSASVEATDGRRPFSAAWHRLRSMLSRPSTRIATQPSAEVPTREEMARVLRTFIALAASEPALQAFAEDRHVMTHYVLSDYELEFHLSFENGQISGDLGLPPYPAQVRIETDADTLDGMFTGRINAPRAAVSGKLSFGGDTRQALSIQRIQSDLSRLYCSARERRQG
jgi:ketol-acid reductoisomerase